MDPQASQRKAAFAKFSENIDKLREYEKSYRSGIMSPQEYNEKVNRIEQEQKLLRANKQEVSDHWRYETTTSGETIKVQNY